MMLSQRSRVSWAGLGLFWMSQLAAEPQIADLTGYGKLEWEVRRESAGEGIASFTCEDAEHADSLMSKLLADYSWDRLLGVRSVAMGDGSQALELEGCGLLWLARRGTTVFAVAGRGQEGIQSLRQRRGLRGGDLVFSPVKPHPISLDFFDLRSVSLYYHSLNSLNQEKGLKRYDPEVLSRAAAFWKRFGFGVSTFEPYFGLDELADGAAHFYPLRHTVTRAKADGAVVMAHLGQHLAPWWMRNRFPDDIVQWDPNVISSWNPLPAMAGTHLSQFAAPEAYAYARRFTAGALQALQQEAGENLGCVRVAGGGHPGDEIGVHQLSTEFMDYDEAGQEAFRNWLRQSRKLSLAELGRRWFDDAGHFRAWSEVRIPSHFEFFGGFGDDGFDLRSGWHWRPDGARAEAEGWGMPAYQPGEEWTAVDLAPSAKQLFLFGSERDAVLREGKSTAAWFRKEFDASEWLDAHAREPVYLVAHVNDEHTKPVEVFFNEAYLGFIRPKAVRFGPIAFDATKLVRPGRNVLCLKVQSGAIRGPVFLTTEEPKRYPYLGRTGNARWVDLRDWTSEKLVLGWLREARFGREALPDTPLMFTPGAWRGFSDQFLGLKREVGIASIHNTGSEVSFLPWWAGLGSVWGAHMSSEESHTVSAPGLLDRELAWMLLNAQGHHNYYWDAIDCMRIEQQTGWFSRNRRLLELFGKAAWRQPAIAVYRSAATDRLFPYAVGMDDLDAGLQVLPAAHFGNVYVTEAEWKAGLVKDYPVVLDAGSSVMDEEVLAAIEHYVRNGGTFVAWHLTGRHAPLDPDTWRMMKLAGLEVVEEREGETLTIEPRHPLLRQSGGLTIEGSGVAFDAGQIPPEHVLARWKDGALAAAVHPLGRGCVISLGSRAFLQTAIIGDLLSGLGIEKDADVASDEVWLRRFVTKNGLQEWVMAYNAGRGPVQRQTLRFAFPQRPGRVLDMVTGQSVNFDFRDGEVQVPGFGLEPNQLGIFAVNRGNVLEAVDHWFALKRHYESRPAPASRPEVLPAPPAEAIVFDKLEFRPGRADQAAEWKPAGAGFWDELGYPGKGAGQYRQSFSVPASWQGRRVLLAFASFDAPVFLENATVFINEQPAGQYRAHGWANFDVVDVTPLLMTGENSLRVAVEAPEVRGGYLGQLVIFPLERLDDQQDLSAGWKVFADNRNFECAGLPLEKSGRHVETEITLPENWKGREVFLEFEARERWVGLVVINGRPIGFNQSLHPYADIMQVNLHPWAKPGERNQIELWPRTPEETARQKMIVRAARIGIVNRK